MLLHCDRIIVADEIAPDHILTRIRRNKKSVQQKNQKGDQDDH